MGPCLRRALKRFLCVNAVLWWWEKSGRTVPEIFAAVVARHPDKVAFHFENKRWTYREVDELSSQLGRYFSARGLKRGDSVALFMDSRAEYVCAWLGLAKSGIVAALINTNLRQGPLVHCIRAANSRAVIVGSELAAALREVTGELADLSVYEWHESGESSTSVIPGAINLRESLVPVDKSTLITKGGPRDKLVYIYTSGTTGMPKAAVVTNLRFMFMVTGVYYMLGLKPDDTLYDPLPLYHTAGGMLGTGQAILYGLTVVIRRKFSASNFWTDCVKYDCTVAQYIGEICRYLLSTPKKDDETKHRIRLMFGNGLRPQIWQPFVERFKVGQIGEFYGATEGNSNIVNIDNTVGAVGFIPRYAAHVYPVALIRVDKESGEPIRGKNGLCIVCKPGEPGVFVGKIDSKKAINDFSGYADSKATEKKIIKDVFKKGDKVFNSGDMLVMDELGYFFFKDRIGDTFRWRGENVSTAEVEAIISNVVELNDAVVYGVEVPNVEGRAGMAAIVDEQGNLDLKKLAEGVKKNLPAYARPLFLRVLTSLPKTGTYKLKKQDLLQEGFDPNVISDKLYYFENPGNYIPLTPELYNDILVGKVRL
ncbi:Luciferin 4-monooxygenase [Gryllus bimaculatus]|nr:Luciferin 4-monooxygenase [Gryllus bimaculatus]